MLMKGKIQKEENSMNTANLTEYLSILVDMEKNIDLQNRLIASINYKMNQLDSEQMEYGKEPMPPTEEKKSSSGIILIGSGFLFLFGLFLAGSGSSGQVVGALFMFIGLVIFIAGQLGNTSRNEQINAQWKQYGQEKEEYEKAAASWQTRREVLLVNLRELEQKNEQSKKALQDMYSLNVIFPKYRNFVMLCSLYEYLSSGRCMALEGHEGAYNLLEQEMRMDLIITKLDRAILQLDEIRSNQFALYSVVQESNHQFVKLLSSTEQMVNSLQMMRLQGDELNARIADLQKNSELAAYQSECTKKELHYMNRMKYLTGEYDGTFFNSPSGE